MISLTFIFFIIIISILSVYSGFDFASALEEASANNVQKRGYGRILDLGWTGRVIFSVLFVAVMLALSHLSKSIELLNIVTRCILVFLVVLNIFLRINGVRAFKVFVALWLGNLISALKETGFTIDQKNAQLFILIQLVAFVLLFLGTALGNLIYFHRNIEAEPESKKEDEGSNEEEGTESDSEDVSKNLATNKFVQWLKSNWEILIVLIVAIAAIIMVVTL